MTSTAARAASGMYSVNGRSHMTTTTRNRECTMAEMDECAPARTLVAVRAMAPVAAKPPKNTEATLPIPCEISSIFELCLSPVMLSATTQASSDSMPALSMLISACFPPSILIWKRRWAGLATTGTVLPSGLGHDALLHCAIGKAIYPYWWTITLNNFPIRG